jgi:hypothetical protein
MAWRSRVLPASAASAAASSGRVERGAAGKNSTIATATWSSAAETRSRFAAPTLSTSSAVIAEPLIEPSVPPTAMKPKSRFACPLRKVSAMNCQNTDSTNRLKTLVQMKKPRPAHTVAPPLRHAR